MKDNFWNVFKIVQMIDEDETNCTLSKDERIRYIYTKILFR